MEHNLLAISPIDGRYSSKVDHLSQYFSEAALMRYRILVEIEWFIFIFNDLELKGTKKLDITEIRMLRSIYEQFDVSGAQEVKEIENTTNHDVKSIEYYIKASLKGGSLEKYCEFLHFACTSEDINNLSYGCMIRDFKDRELLPTLSGLVQELYAMALKYKGLAMMSRTHGQPASPTTLGKELVNVVARLEREMEMLAGSDFLMGKMNGATGNYNAHVVAYPEIDWTLASTRFIEALGLVPNLYTTQIEPHDCYADVFDAVKRINTIVLDFDRDMWSYISIGYFKQKTVKGEVGSSTMPHKVNPIDFENSEGNLGFANAILEHLSAKLPVSRMQRDLTDSTVLRNIGLAFSYCVLAYKSTIKGFSKCLADKDLIRDDLKDRWELLAEPVQTVMRKYAIEGAYEKLKEVSRGKKLTKMGLHKLVKDLKIPANEKKRLLALTPEKYVGLAQKLVEAYKLGVAAESEGCGPSGCGGCQGCG